MTRTRRILLWAVGGVVAIVAFGFLWFAAMVSGGWDDLFGGGGPKRTDAKVVAAIDRTRTDNQRELQALLEQRVQPVMGTSSVTLAWATAKGCDTGQHNWKRDDSYHLLCTVTDAVLVTGLTTELHDRMLALDHAISSEPEWAGRHYLTVSRVVGQYWDSRESRPDADEYAPWRLPQAGYDGRSPGHTLHVSWAMGPDTGIRLSSFTQNAQWRAPDGTPLTQVQAGALLPTNGDYALLVEIQRTAFEG